MGNNAMCCKKPDEPLDKAEDCNQMPYNDEYFDIKETAGFPKDDNYNFEKDIYQSDLNKNSASVVSAKYGTEDNYKFSTYVDQDLNKNYNPTINDKYETGNNYKSSAYTEPLKSFNFNPEDTKPLSNLENYDTNIGLIKKESESYLLSSTYAEPVRVESSYNPIFNNYLETGKIYNDIPEVSTQSIKNETINYTSNISVPYEPANNEASTYINYSINNNLKTNSYIEPSKKETYNYSTNVLNDNLKANSYIDPVTNENFPSVLNTLENRYETNSYIEPISSNIYTNYFPEVSTQSIKKKTVNYTSNIPVPYEPTTNNETSTYINYSINNNFKANSYIEPVKNEIYNYSVNALNNNYVEQAKKESFPLVNNTLENKYEVNNYMEPIKSNNYTNYLPEVSTAFINNQTLNNTNYSTGEQYKLRNYSVPIENYSDSINNISNNNYKTTSYIKSIKNDLGNSNYISNENYKSSDYIEPVKEKVISYTNYSSNNNYKLPTYTEHISNQKASYINPISSNTYFEPIEPILKPRITFPSIAIDNTCFGPIEKEEINYINYESPAFIESNKVPIVSYDNPEIIDNYIPPISNETTFYNNYQPKPSISFLSPPYEYEKKYYSSSNLPIIDNISRPNISIRKFEDIYYNKPINYLYQEFNRPEINGIPRLTTNIRKVGFGNYYDNFQRYERPRTPYQIQSFENYELLDFLPQPELYKIKKYNYESIPELDNRYYDLRFNNNLKYII